MTDEASTPLATELNRAILDPESAWSEERFNTLALRLFERQYSSMANYTRLCHGRRATPGSLLHWKQIPPVATELFKQFPFYAGPPEEHPQVFTTSGTTQFTKGQSRFSNAGLQVMKSAMLAAAGRMLFPDVKRQHILVLAPSPAQAPQMIMAWGMQQLVEHWGTQRSGFYIGTEGLDFKKLHKDLSEFEERNEPVTLIGASFGFVNLMEGLEKQGICYRLAASSRVMDAGGFKGRSKTLQRDELQHWFQRFFGVPPTHTVNLLGMTELATQFYDDTLRSHFEKRATSGLKQNPPWTRTEVVDPLTLTPRPPGKEGVLLHTDLANLDTPMRVLTDDLGTANSRGFEIRGRVSTDTDRGCSLTVDELSRKGI